MAQIDTIRSVMNQVHVTHVYSYNNTFFSSLRKHSLDPQLQTRYGCSTLQILLLLMKFTLLLYVKRCPYIPQYHQLMGVLKKDFVCVCVYKFCTKWWVHAILGRFLWMHTHSRHTVASREESRKWSEWRKLSFYDYVDLAVPAKFVCNRTLLLFNIDEISNEIRGCRIDTYTVYLIHTLSIWYIHCPFDTYTVHLIHTLPMLDDYIEQTHRMFNN